MTIQECIARMSRSARVIVDLARELPSEQARWRPQPQAWSVLEVINHLADEEKDDFRTRLEYTLQRPGESWPPIDPQRWCIERRYNERDLQESLGRFEAEREKSLAWLEGLGEPDWEARHEHPSFGALRAGDLMLSWMVHDFLHTRQLVKLHYLHSIAGSQPYSADYAGGWS